MAADDAAPRDLPDLEREKIKRALKSRSRLEAIAHGEHGEVFAAARPAHTQAGRRVIHGAVGGAYQV